MNQGSGIEIDLEDTICDYIREWTADHFLMIKTPEMDPSFPSDLSQIEYGPPAVHAGMIPRTEVGTFDVSRIPVYPFVLVHIFKGKDLIPEGCVYTKIVCGVWNPDTNYQGYRDAVVLLRKIIRKLWYEDTLANTYQHNVHEGSEWRVYDSNEVTYPFWMAECVYGWRMRTPFVASESDGLDIALDPAISRQPIIPGVGPNVQTFDTDDSTSILHD